MERMPRRPDESMSLLVDLMTSGSVDPGYAEAAQRRREARGSATAKGLGTPGGPSRRRTTPAMLLAFLLLGLIFAAAVAQLRSREPSSNAAREALVSLAKSRTQQTDDLEARAVRLREEVSAARERALSRSAAGSALDAQASALELAAGALPVQGPGLRVTVADAPTPTPNPVTGQVPDQSTAALGRIYDRDLQSIVNALWAAGAEAIAINGQRLSSESAIRSAGEAILVDYRPLSPPYRIEAVGNPDTLAARFADSAVYRAFLTYVSAVGIRFDTTTSSRMTLPATSGIVLHYATPAGGPQ